MTRMMLAVLSGLLLSCQGPAAVLAREAWSAAAPIRVDGTAPAIRLR